MAIFIFFDILSIFLFCSNYAVDHKHVCFSWNFILFNNFPLNYFLATFSVVCIVFSAHIPFHLDMKSNLFLLLLWKISSFSVVYVAYLSPLTHTPSPLEDIIFSCYEKKKKKLYFFVVCITCHLSSNPMPIWIAKSIPSHSIKKKNLHFLLFALVLLHLNCSSIANKFLKHVLIIYEDCFLNVYKKSMLISVLSNMSCQTYFL